MRVISQDGFCDIPYESIIVIHSGAGKQVYARGAVNGEFQCMLAVYSSKEKVLKAMEMLRKVYYDNKHEETYKDGLHAYSPIFRFPKDDEI